MRQVLLDIHRPVEGPGRLERGKGGTTSENKRAPRGREAALTPHHRWSARHWQCQPAKTGLSGRRAPPSTTMVSPVM